MTTIEKKEIRGITLPLIRVFIGGTFTVCCTVIGAAVHIEKSFTNHEVRITKIEQWQVRHEQDDKERGAAIWGRFTEMDNRIYGLQGKNNRNQQN